MLPLSRLPFFFALPPRPLHHLVNNTHKDHQLYHTKTPSQLLPNAYTKAFPYANLILQVPDARCEPLRDPASIHRGGTRRSRATPGHDLSSLDYVI